MDGQEAKSGREFAVSLLDSQMVQMLMQSRYVRVRTIYLKKSMLSSKRPRCLENLTNG